MEFFMELSPPLRALIAGLFTWGFTALGASGVFLAKRPGQKTLDVMLGFAGGVMVAASFWSLLAPAIEISEELGYPGWLPPVAGFLAGGAALRLLDMAMPHLHPAMAETAPDGPPSSLRRTTLLVLAITLHNIPEGLAVGVAFGAMGAMPEATFAGAAALALGMGLQNFPEGLAVSMPLRREGLSRARAFFYRLLLRAALRDRRAGLRVHRRSARLGCAARPALRARVRGGGYDFRRRRRDGAGVAGLGQRRPRDDGLPHRLRRHDGARRRARLGKLPRAAEARFMLYLGVVGLAFSSSDATAAVSA